MSHERQYPASVVLTIPKKVASSENMASGSAVSGTPESSIAATAKSEEVIVVPPAPLVTARDVHAIVIVS